MIPAIPSKSVGGVLLGLSADRWSSTLISFYLRRECNGLILNLVTIQLVLVDLIVHGHCKQIISSELPG